LRTVKTTKLVAIISGALAIILALSPVITKLLRIHIIGKHIETYAIGIIGAADGPSAIMIASYPSNSFPIICYGIAAVCAIVSVWAFVLLRKMNKRTEQE